jgi:hypothetical protein
MKNTQIFSFVFNRPDLLQRQIDCFKKFFSGNYEINVVCDYRDEKYLKEFETICSDNEVRFYSHKSNNNMSPSEYHGATVTWAYNEIMLKDCLDDYVLIIDHDMFLIDEFSLVDYMKNYDISGALQERGDIKYVWPGLIIMDIAKVKDIEFDFHPCIAEGQMLDTGGGTYKLLRSGLKYKDTGIEYPDHYKDIDLHDNNLTGGFGFEMHCDGLFLHSRNASSWHNNFAVQDSMKSNLLYNILSDIIDDKTKNYLEVVVARYNEDLRWSNKYEDYLTVYNKGEDEISGSIKLENIGREAHTYLYHIVNNYDDLADYTVFLQGEPLNPHSPTLYRYLDYVLHSNEYIPDFFWISTRIVEGDFEYEREPYHKVFPNIRYAFEKVFGKQPPEKFTFGAGAQFCLSRDQIRKRSKEFYQNILDIFEHNPDEPDELTLKLLGKHGRQNPELAYQMERFWGLVFTYEV